MNIKIDILVSAKNEESFLVKMKMYQIEALRKRLLSDYGFNCTIYRERPSYQPHAYYLFFTDSRLNYFEKNQTKDLVLIGISADEIFDSDYFNKFEFAAIVEIGNYLRNILLLYGNKEVIKDPDLECIKTHKNNYGLISGSSKKGILDLIVKYLIAFDELKH